MAQPANTPLPATPTVPPVSLTAMQNPVVGRCPLEGFARGDN